jgi:hypothetical protein
MDRRSVRSRTNGFESRPIAVVGERLDGPLVDDGAVENGALGCRQQAHFATSGRSPVEVGRFHDFDTPVYQGKLGGRGGT